MAEEDRNRPNIFKYATSELSQDAFLCWLLDWADCTRGVVNPDLHNLGAEFLRGLFCAAGKAEEFPPAPFSVSLSPQCQRVDIVAAVGLHHVILIEDKVGSQQHDNQLARYASTVATHVDFKDKTQILIYLKTDEPTPDELEKIAAAPGWHLFNRHQLLEVLGTASHKVKSDIFDDFLGHLVEIDREVLAFRDKPIVSWTKRTWAGFFGQLRKELSDSLADGSWGYVPNQQGGFMGMWWSFLNIDGGQIYLQAEEKNLTVKLTGFPKERALGMANLWSDTVTTHMPEVKRPARLKSGTWMSIAVAKDPWLRCDASDRVLVRDTSEHLRHFTNRFKTLLESSCDPT